ncbi:MAG: hypothetical protein ACOX3E_10210 [Desulfomonilia bacterium]|jgi:hypothetical protein|uniref:Uncharacterized protein n=1 Tax=anaerobic digester metagenome TaxID=1263854 RepID=A0A485M2C1_9ZZZZ|nr:hypothetical protein [Pseudomonadota bacterium]HON37807.1 hypothetical protein [Deltaproteobacteria bacterium]HRS55698.1 hypothetical protein [Desulfomonilia bacterium]HPD20827.1 hypothetical protein [Deltaproteobacteria bacterium]HPX18356.1 hypothetical protein [Deltaproteobacteria bacterium]
MEKNSRFELGHTEKIRRSIYVFLRDELERKLKTIALEEPYQRCQAKKVPYPYVDSSELRPKKKEFSKESSETRPFFIIFYEDTLDEIHQKYIRFSDSNRVRKDTISLVPDIKFHRPFYSTIRFFERDSFFELLEQLIDVDYCLLIQRDNRYKKRNRYSLTHFHVKVDWPIAEAAESLAKELRYISKSLYEKGERYAEILQQKLFEYYGCHHQGTGGRRTGALSAAQYLKSVPGLATVYVSSAETKTLTRYSEKGVGRYAVIQFDKALAKQLIEAYNLTEESFRQGYALGESEQFFDVILFVTYKHTEWGTPPPDGKLRILRPDYSWLAVDMEMILPMPHAVSFRPLPVKWVYKT